jgi:hypothetical protein
MPLTGYDRDSERLGFPRGPRGRRVLAVVCSIRKVCFSGD